MRPRPGCCRAAWRRSAGSSDSQSQEPASLQCGSNPWLAASTKAIVDLSEAVAALVLMPTPASASDEHTVTSDT
jgi:hypothetical protein